MVALDNIDGNLNALNPFKRTRRCVVKVGSALLVDPKTGTLRGEWLDAFTADIAALKAKDIDVIIVSSGAIALGRSILGVLNRSLTLAEKQACAAIGQSHLTSSYNQAFSNVNVIGAQALFTLYDTENRRRWLNARSTVEALLGFGCVPIINENDTVATDEIRVGDNDRLAARTAQMVGAETLILLSDIDGLYDKNPRTDASAIHIPVIEKLTSDVLAMAGGINPNGALGTGGMVTKLQAGQIATEAGCDMCIMDGRAPAPLSRLISGATCSWFKARLDPKAARRQWIVGSLRREGRIMIDAGALSALKRGRSLLAAGVLSADGAFEKGDAVDIQGPSGAIVARGLVGYGIEETRKIAGRKSSEIADILGYDNGAALIHRDNMVLLSS